MADPPTAFQIDWTSAVGPPINVVPVSIAANAAFPVEMGTDFPWAVTAVKVMMNE